ncbi:tetratricopeptide repeat protein [Micromonospora sp. CA-263727]|uniref:tetratricopeptide repeat protein n=1 Tax=Micromonospora sp. CA-263727 TaxID=3239967 RepID=UPI003D9489F9
MPDSTGAGAGAGVAQAALDTVQRCPREAIAMAQRLLADRPVDHDDRSTAERAIGLALRELNDLPGALRHLRRAVRTAGTARTRALARMSLGYVLANAGRTAAALRAVTAALPQLTGADAGRARMQRGVVLHFRGRYDEAVRDYGLAIDIAQREGDPLLEARARNNRGLLNSHRGTAAGADDLSRAAAAFQGLGLDLAAADARWNGGIAAGRRGDIAAALRCFAAVGEEYQRLAVPRPALLLDRFEVLLSVPLVDEAVEVATVAIGELRRQGMASDLAEALLARARAALLAGDLDTATGSAAAARTRFRRQGRRTWAAFARHVELRAEFRRGARSPALLAAMVRTADQLAATGWPDPALTTRIEAGLLAKAVGRGDRAVALFETAARARRRGTAPGVPRVGTPWRWRAGSGVTNPVPPVPCTAGWSCSTGTAPRSAPPSCARTAGRTGRRWRPRGWTSRSGPARRPGFSPGRNGGAPTRCADARRCRPTTLIWSRLSPSCGWSAACWKTRCWPAGRCAPCVAGRPASNSGSGIWPDGRPAEPI